ncbi:MAG: glycosyltransferase family 2 protein [Bacteroidales bacterium]|nr:glycosyltransferase family 2 protein [Bacteroidales bacterium]
MSTLLIVCFWIALFIVFYTYIGYGMLIYILLAIRRSKKPKQDTIEFSSLPEVSLIIAAFNEEAVVESKMANCRELIYPSEKLQICWITDGSNDRTNQLLKAYPDVIVHYQPERQGKTAAINRGMMFVKTPIVVFTDANTNINDQALLEIVKRFADPKVGCVTGEKRIASKEAEDATAGEGIYWKYESFLKTLDDQFHTAVGAAGELFAIRRELFDAMPRDTLLDDFILSMRIAAKGFKIAYCQTAYALEEPSLDIKEEEKRKVRIAAGGLQSIIRLKHLLNPFRYGLLSFQYISHRVLRWSVTPILLFLLFPLNIALLFAVDKCILLYVLTAIFQVLFYTSGLVGFFYARKQIKHKLLYIPYYFLFMNINVIKGFFYLVNHKGNGVWEKAKRAER